MKSGPLVSIIVPVYNVEKYLRRCCDSIINQTYNNIEVLLIDDGSTDRSGELCDKIAIENSRFRVIHKENEGLGLTRNCGIKSSKGEFVFFLDSDDYIEAEAVEVLVQFSTEWDCDLVIGNFIYQGDKTDIPIQTGFYSGEAIKKEILPRIIGNKPGFIDQLTPSSCGKLYRKSIFFEKDIWFPSERELIWEDLAFNFEYIQMCNRVYLTDFPVYNYCFNGASLTHKYDPMKLKKVMRMYRYMQGVINEADLGDIVGRRLECNFIGHIRTCLKLESFYAPDNGRKKTLTNIKDMCNDADVQKILRNYGYKYYSISQKLFSIAIRLRFVFLVYLMCKIQNSRKKIV